MEIEEPDIEPDVETIEDKILKQRDKLDEIIKECPLFLLSEYDPCNDFCIVCLRCWELQDQERELLKSASQTLELEEIQAGEDEVSG